MPSFAACDDFIWSAGPGEKFGVFAGFGKKAIESGSEINEGGEGTPLEAPFSEFGKAAFDGVAPRAGCWRDVENEQPVAIRSGPKLRPETSYA